MKFRDQITAAWVLGCLLAVPAWAQVSEPEYLRALPGYVYSFPRDHGAHPEYKLEWWYFTGHLDAANGRTFGYELTFFRIGMDRVALNPSVWNVRDLHVAHFALSELDRRRFRFFERANREGPGIARTAVESLDVRNESWTARLDGDGIIKLRAYASGVLLELDLESVKQPVVHGIDGVSQKAAGIGQASHYYSLPRMATTGLLSMDGVPAAVSGESWMDHEFGTNQLGPEQVGWDWFGLQFENGVELMLYQMRNRDGSVDRSSSGTIVAPDGTFTHLTVDNFNIESHRDWESADSGAVYRLDWTVAVPEEGTLLSITPLMDNQEMVTMRSTGFPYWEGAVRVEGTWRGEPVNGRGYVELTGYGEDFRPDV